MQKMFSKIMELGFFNSSSTKKKRSNNKFKYHPPGGFATDRPFNRPTDRPPESDRKRPRHPTDKVCKREDSSVKSVQ